MIKSLSMNLQGLALPKTGIIAISTELTGFEESYDPNKTHLVTVSLFCSIW